VFESIASYKGLVIALILSNGDLIKIELFDDTCAEFWNKNVITHERKYPMPRKIITSILSKVKIVVGYHCSNKEAN
jgi:hypothetical protein